MPTTTPWQGPEVWTGEDLARDESWLIRLSEDDIAEIGQALRVSDTQGLKAEEISRETFPLPGLGPVFTAAQREVIRGRGFVVIRGLPVADWPLEDLARAYWGIGRWFGDPVPQNGKGHLLGHIIDLRKDGGAAQRIYQTSRAQPFHSDSCDIVGLLCLRRSKTGGESAVASAAAAHNWLLERDPDALDRLYEAFHCDRWDEVPEGKEPYYQARIFNRDNGFLTCCGMDPDIRSAQRLAEVPALTTAQLAALDVLQQACRAVALNMILQPGDIQLLHNHTVLHARGAFEDHDDPAMRRYLLRLWLSAPNGRPLPAFLGERWGNIEAGRLRGGIRVKGVRPNLSLEPEL